KPVTEPNAKNINSHFCRFNYIFQRGIWPIGMFDAAISDSKGIGPLFRTAIQKLRTFHTDILDAIVKGKISAPFLFRLFLLKLITDMLESDGYIHQSPCPAGRKR